MYVVYSQLVGQNLVKKITNGLTLIPVEDCLLQGRAQKSTYVFLQPTQRVALDVHHVAGVVVTQGDFLVLRRRQVHVVERVAGGEERRGQIVISVCYKQFHVGVLDESQTQRFAGVGKSFAGGSPVPFADSTAQYVVLEITLETEIGAHVIVKRCRKR